MPLNKHIVKEIVLSTIYDAGQTRANVSDVPSFKNYGCAKQKKFSYYVDNICICYNKLIVEDTELTKHSNGAQYHNRLVGPLSVVSKKLGYFQYTGAEAQEIINIIETFDENSYQR